MVLEVLSTTIGILRQGKNPYYPSLQTFCSLVNNMFLRLDSTTAPILLTEGFTESRFGFALSSAGDTDNDG